jgi:hypothetical protein
MPAIIDREQMEDAERQLEELSLSNQIALRRARKLVDFLRLVYRNEAQILHSLAQNYQH